MNTLHEKQHVLLIDDDPFQLKLISHQLATLDVEMVKSCSNGADALTYLDGCENGELLILLDLCMPEMDGVEFVRRLVEREYAGALALVSGEEGRVLETAVKLARARRLNVVGHLDKPVQSDALRALLQSWRTHITIVAGKAHRAYAPEEIQRAIAGGELFNVYQPKVGVATGALSGVETLVRWRHPQDGLVFPDQFIGVAEKHDLIDELTSAVLTEALIQAKRWREEGSPLRISVNISMDNLKALDFPDFVQNAISCADISSAEIILEVTESRLTEDHLTPLDILTRLRLKHISLSIDDFGTGYSSLAQLRDIPFDELKIDRSFVHGAAKNATLRSIFEASLAMARQLGMTVVAEGVEDQNDWMFLRERGCDLAQGYFIAKPMPAADIRPWRSAWEARTNKLAVQ